MKRKVLLDAFEADLDAEGSFILPQPENANTMPDNKSYIHRAYTSVDETHTVEWHITRYWDNVAQNVVKAQFYVVDRNTPSEDATWFQGKNPKPPEPEPTFQSEVVTWLQSKVTDATIVHFANVQANEQTERATCDVVIDDAGTFVERRVGLWRDGSGNFVYQVIQR